MREKAQLVLDLIRVTPTLTCRRAARWDHSHSSAQPPSLKSEDIETCKIKCFSPKEDLPLNFQAAGICRLWLDEVWPFCFFFLPGPIQDRAVDEGVSADEDFYVSVEERQYSAQSWA